MDEVGNNVSVGIHISACLMMTGLIWLIQVVHYPSFRFIEAPKFHLFHHFHTRRITWIVGPLMGTELLTGAALALSLKLFWLGNFLLVVVLWMTTGLISVPLHNRLAKNYDSKTVKRLIQTNWVRTAIWSLRTAGFLFLLLNSWNSGNPWNF